MNVLLDVIIALLATVGMGVALWALLGRMLTPVGGMRSNITAVVRAEGSAPELEHTVDGLLWLNKSRAARMNILIADAGMDADARKVADLLAKYDGRIQVCPIEDIAKYLNGS